MKRFLCLFLAVFLLLPCLFVSAGAVTYDEAFAIYDFDNVVKEGTNLFAEDAEWFVETNGFAKGYQVPLARNTWYYVDASTNMAAPYGKLSSYQLRDNNGDVIVSVSPYTYPQFIFYSGNSTMLYAYVVEGEPQPAADQVVMNRLKSFDMAFDILKTSFEWDMKNMFPSIDLTRYSKNVSSEDYFEILTMYEDLDAGRVYMYVYNPSGKEITGGSFEMINGSSATLVPAGRKVSTETYRAPFFTKLEVRGWAYRHPKDGEGNNIESVRRYDMGDVTFAYRNGTAKTFENEVVFTVRDNTAATQTLALSTDTGSKTVQVERDSKIYLDIGYTWYRTDTSSEGVYLHNQVDSIYFNVPNELLEGYGELTNVVIEYNHVRTKPVIVTDEYGLYANFLRPYTLGDASVFEDASLLYIGNLENSWDKTSFQVAYDLNEIYEDTFFGAFYVTDADAGHDDPKATVTYETLSDWLYNYPISGETVTGANGEIDADLFETVERDVVIETGDLNLSADGYATNHNGFEEWINFGWSFKNDEAAENDSLDLSTKIVKIHHDRQIKINGADGLYYAEDDQSDLLNCFAQSQQTDSTMYLVRFNVSQYYSRPYSWCWGFLGDVVEDQMYIAQQDMYLDLNVIGLDFTSDTGEVTAVEVESNHIDCIAPLTPEKDPNEVNQEIRDENFAALKETVTDAVKWIGIILGIVALVVVIVVFGPVIAPFLSRFFKMVGDFFRRLAERWKAAIAEIKKNRKKNPKGTQKKKTKDSRKDGTN